MKLALRCALAAAIALVAVACDDESSSSAPSVTVPPAPEYSPGHWAVDARGVAIDDEDIKIFGSGIDADTIGSDFGFLVLNRPYVDNPTGCPSGAQVPQVQPLATAERFLSAAAARGVDFDDIAVNVDLLVPRRNGLLHACPPDKPRFDDPAHRESVVEAFEDLAGLDGVRSITVGLDMNAYYHLELDGERMADDYSNYVTLYREVYHAIKAVNADIKVGPGLSWATFMRLTVPEIADEYGITDVPASKVLADPFLFEAVQIAARRTVWPLLDARNEAGERVSIADFVGFSIIPRQNEAPFNGNPQADRAEVLAHYRYMDEVAKGRPVVLPQIDWETQSRASANSKATFLTAFKEAVSHVNIAWVAWRRLANVPELDGASSPCRRFTEAQDPRLNYSIDYCYAGLINDLGQVQGAYNILTTNP